MRVFDQNNRLVAQPDLAVGRLVEDTLFVAHHPAVEAVAEQGHYKTVAEYPNGGRDVEWVVDVPGVVAQDAWDEYEDILRYIPYTADELAAIETAKNKPTQLDRIEAQLAYTAMMTDTLLEV